VGCWVKERLAYGSDAVLTDARIRESFMIAVILLGGGGVDAGQLGADEGALGLLVLAPVFPVGLRDGVWLDLIRIILLGLVLGNGEACDGKDAEGEDGAHIVV
jgi:hypothetical protein